MDQIASWEQASSTYSTFPEESGTADVDLTAVKPASFVTADEEVCSPGLVATKGVVDTYNVEPDL